MRKKHNLLIGERTAEDIKIKVGSAYPKAEVTTMNVRGRNLVTGLPKTVEVKLRGDRGSFKRGNFTDC